MVSTPTPRPSTSSSEPSTNPNHLSDVVDAHAESLGVKIQRALPRRSSEAPLVVALGLRERSQQVGLADTAQHARHHDVGDGEIVAGDPLAVLEASLDIGEPAVGELAYVLLE